MVDLFHLVKSQDFCACHEEKHVQIVAQTVKAWWTGQYFAYRRCGFYINPKNTLIILFKESSLDTCTSKSKYVHMRVLKYGRLNMGESPTGSVLLSQFAKGGVDNSNKRIGWKKLPVANTHVVQHVSSYSSLISSRLSTCKLNETTLRKYLRVWFYFDGLSSTRMRVLQKECASVQIGNSSNPAALRR